MKKSYIYLVVLSATLLIVLFAVYKYRADENISPYANRPAPKHAEQDSDEALTLKNYEEKLAALLSAIREKHPQLQEWEGIIDRTEAEDKDLAERCKAVKQARLDTHKQFFSKNGSITYRFYLWEKFYKEPIIDADIESEPDDYKDRIFSYICKIDPVRIVETAHIIDSDKFQADAQDNPAINNVPEALQDIKADDEVFVKEGEEWRKWNAFHHLLRHTYTKNTAETYVNAIKKSLQDINCDLQGKSLLDVGTGSGVCLPIFRSYIGKNAVLAATDIDPYALDACAYLNKDFNVKTFVCNEKDIEAPENSYDIITMLRVHLGPGIGHIYESHTVPWLQSVRKALKPGGLLVIYDDEQRIRTEIEKYVAPIGFEKVCYKDQPPEEMFGNYIYIFRVKK